MAKYAILQAPAINEVYINISGQIVIIDTTSGLKQRQMDYLIRCGYNHLGWIESEASPGELMNGFKAEVERKLERITDAYRGFAKSANDILDLNW